MQSFTDLKVWQRAHEFTLLIYKATANFPSEEKFGLTSQLRRAAVSIESNIAEGRGRGSDKDFGRFISMAMGSCFERERCVVLRRKSNHVVEVKSQILIARDLNFISATQSDFLEVKVDEVSRMLNSLKIKLMANS
ncbi:four helix bundle protein [Pleurocapsa sp. PCC 7319]|uniref:four helix bundle protein n=1 Tax=Pleurocapsa sp. PCC 7319 TaxID=118161 RepID=UPI000346F98D|nr:four helix bundle protein [Pleurocapsa sp. PCC 7319]